MNKIISTLEGLGLNNKEVKIYLASLSMWQTTASILWSKASIARSTAQYTCNSLVEKRLMNITPKWNSFLYSPEPPEKLISMVNKEYTQIEKKMLNTHSIMEHLNNLANPNAKLPKVKYYTGVDGIIDMFEDVLKDKNDIYGFLQISDDMNSEIFEYLNNTYAKKRNSIWLNAYSIFNESELSKKIYEKSKNVNRQVLLIPYDIYPIESCIQIYWNKVAFYSYKNNDLTWVIIDNPNVAKTQKSLFDWMWNLAKSINNN